MTLKLSVLDQTAIYEGETAEEVFRHTVKLAQHAEEIGYERFWVSEHHDSDKAAGSSPEVLIAFILAQTKRIRVGSGGVLLQHYSPYKVAENFNVLASLAPGRVDLGIGKAPGGLPLATKALQKELKDGGRPLEEKLDELKAFLEDGLAPDHEFAGLKAVPEPKESAAVHLLGTGAGTARLAAEKGHALVLAHFLNPDPPALQEAISYYRSAFSGPGRPHVILCISVIGGETDEEAEELAADHEVVRLHFKSGKTLTITSLKKAEAYREISDEPFTIEQQKSHVMHGSEETISRILAEFNELYAPDEIMVVSPVKNFAGRVRSLETILAASKRRVPAAEA